MTASSGSASSCVELQASVEDARAQVAQVADFLSTQAGPAEGGVAQGVDARRAQRLAVRNERQDAPENRRRGLGRQLLTDDRADERSEMVLALPLRHAARTDPLDGGAKDGIAAHQQPSGARVVGRSHKCNLQFTSQFQSDVTASTR